MTVVRGCTSQGIRTRLKSYSHWWTSARTIWARTRVRPTTTWARPPRRYMWTVGCRASAHAYTPTTDKPGQPDLSVEPDKYADKLRVSVDVPSPTVILEYEVKWNAADEEANAWKIETFSPMKRECTHV